MIAALLIAWPAIALIACATPRQADHVFGRGRIDPPRRARRAGAALLLLSFCVALAGGDPARHVVGWLIGSGVMAIATALGFSALATRSR